MMQVVGEGLQPRPAATSSVARVFCPEQMRARPAAISRGSRARGSEGFSPKLPTRKGPLTDRNIGGRAAVERSRAIRLLSRREGKMGEVDCEDLS